MTEEQESGIGIGVAIAIFISVSILLIILVVFGVSAAYSKYSVWSSSQAGKAQLAQADWNRQIAVREAQAKEQSATLLAQAEIIRAQGVATANKIIGDSLKNNEAYLRYLFVNNLADTKDQVIYVPTEANLPILEAGKRAK